MHNIQKLLIDSEAQKLRECLLQIKELGATDQEPLVDAVFRLLWMLQKGSLIAVPKEKIQGLRDASGREIEEIIKDFASSPASKYCYVDILQA